jgi:hypothetical protein
VIAKDRRVLRRASPLSLSLVGCTIIGDLGRDDVSGSGSADASEGGSGDSGGIDTKLPTLPELTNVRVRIVGDAANVTFDPFDGAVDYRIYPLPPDDAIDVRDDGSIVVDHAIYRCAGKRESLYMLRDVVNPDPGWNDNAAGGTSILARDVAGFVRTEADAELGHVYLEEAEGRVPVFALGDPDPMYEGTVECGRPVFAATRSKHYTTDASERDALLAARWRDDGVAFWVPAVADASTRPVYEGVFGDDAVLRWIDGAEGEARGAGTRIFDVLVAPSDGTAPLRRVHLVPYCARPHDELVATVARFEHVRRQADQPLPSLRWSGMAGPTTLVAEALADGCPYQGIVSAQYEPAFDDEGVAHEAWVTPDEMRAASPTGEVFVDGQHEGGAWPKAIARSFVEVEPRVPLLDVYSTFPVDAELRASFGAPTGNVYGLHFDSPAFMLSSYASSHLQFGSLLGEMWLVHTDIGAGVNAMVRLSSHPQGEVGSAGFLHVTGEVDMVTTDRRFAQLMVSDALPPVQDAMPNATTLIVQPSDYAPSHFAVEICDHVAWDLGYECPRVPIFPADTLPAAPLPGETAGSDASVQLEIYLSATRLYVLVDGAPYGCTDLPAIADDGLSHSPPLGAVTITWGSVLAHSAIDFTTGGGDITEPDSYAFSREHMHYTARRRFDNLGFASGVSAPSWDEARVPCN